jgi:hypothetical protein
MDRLFSTHSIVVYHFDVSGLIAFIQPIVVVVVVCCVLYSHCTGVRSSDVMDDNAVAVVDEL